MAVDFKRTIDHVARKSEVGLNYVEQFKSRIDSNDPDAAAKTAYLDGVGFLFSQIVTLAHGDDFARTLSSLMQDQAVLAKRMSFFGKESSARILPAPNSVPAA